MNNNPHGPGFVYLMLSGGEHKIGSARDPEARRTRFQKTSGQPFELLWSRPADDAFTLELALQRRFRPHKVRKREWFALSPEQVAWFTAATDADFAAVLSEYRPTKAKPLVGRVKPVVVPMPPNRQPGKPLEDLTGRTFERWTVVRLAGIFEGNRHPAWLCRCVCGNEAHHKTGSLKCGSTRSCGCLIKDSRHTTHGQSGTPLYLQYRSMVDRCTDQLNTFYHRYGGRGITVHPDWLGPGGFINFIAHIGPKPEGRHDIDRIGPNGNYEPGNVRWLTPRANNRNKADTIHLTHNGETKSLADWAEEVRLPWCTLHHRVHVAGWSVEKALTTPRRPRRLKNPDATRYRVRSL